MRLIHRISNHKNKKNIKFPQKIKLHKLYSKNIIMTKLRKRMKTNKCEIPNYHLFLRLRIWIQGRRKK